MPSEILHLSATSYVRQRRDDVHRIATAVALQATSVEQQNRRVRRSPAAVYVVSAEEEEPRIERVCPLYVYDKGIERLEK